MESPCRPGRGGGRSLIISKVPSTHWRRQRARRSRWPGRRIAQPGGQAVGLAGEPGGVLLPAVATQSVREVHLRLPADPAGTGRLGAAVTAAAAIAPPWGRTTARQSCACPGAGGAPGGSRQQQPPAAAARAGSQFRLAVTPVVSTGPWPPWAPAGAAWPPGHRGDVTSRIVRSRWRSRSGSAASSMAVIVPHVIVKVKMTRGCPPGAHAAPGAPLMRAG